MKKELISKLLFEGTFQVVHKDKYGNIISADPFPIADLITNEGIDYLLNTGVHNGAGNSISGEVGGTGDGSATSFSYTLAQKPQPNSLNIGYTISSTAYTTTDDGAGNISGTDCSGTVNYSTGAVSLTFTTAPDNATDVTNGYSASITSWFFAPFENDYTPVATDTYAAPGYTETSSYSETTRQEWAEGASSGQSITNATAATITANADVTIYGAGIVGGGTAADTIQDTAGNGVLLASGVLTPNSKTLSNGETLDLTYTLNGASS